MKYFDSHCHLNDKEFDSTYHEVYERAKSMDVSPLLVIGWDYESSLKAVQMSEELEGVYALVGFQPENLETISEEALQKIEELTKHPKVVGIGEIGLDYYWFHDPKDHENQKKWFIRQLELANKLDFPVSIHAREALGDTLEILRAHSPKRKGVLHCYSGSVETMVELEKLGYYFGFGGPVTFKNAKEPKRCVEACPLGRLLVETDSPYMAPTPLRGTVNEPKNIPLIAAAVAELKGVNVDKLAEVMKENLERLFRVKHE